MRKPAIELYTIIYTSRETRFLSDEEIDELLRGARSFNEGHDVTGILLFFDLVFFQVLEGPRETLESLYRRIAKDPRHKDMTLQNSEPISSRLFPNWSMSYRKLDGEIVRSGDKLSDILGFNENPDDNVVSMQRHKLTKLITTVAEALGS